jgi:hypothetical protein
LNVGLKSDYPNRVSSLFSSSSSDKLCYSTGRWAHSVDLQGKLILQLMYNSYNVLNLNGYSSFIFLTLIEGPITVAARSKA